MKTSQKQDQYKVYERHGQLVLAINSEIMIPENAPVRLLSAQLEELEYGKLYAAYSTKGRKSAADPRVMFKVLVYGYLNGIYSSRKLEEACRYRLDFMWLLEDRKAPDHSTLARFRTGRCKEAVEDLFYQFVRKLEGMGETDHKAVFIDGTKLEHRAGRYTFVWRKAVEKQLAKVKAELKRETGFNSSAAVRTKLEKDAESISFVHGSGKRKSPEQREWEKTNLLLERWEGYEKCFLPWEKDATAIPRPIRMLPSCDCSDSSQRYRCCRAKDPNQPKEIVLKRPSGRDGSRQRKIS